MEGHDPSNEEINKAKKRKILWFFVRYVGAVVIIIFTIWWFFIFKSVTEENLDTVWCLSGLITTTLITGIIFIKQIFIEGLKIRVERLKGIGILTFIFCLFLVLVCGIGIVIFPHKDFPWISPLVSGTTIIVPLAVFIIDWRLKETGYYPIMEMEWDFVSLFDAGVLTGVVTVNLLKKVIKLPAGFVGGAAAFQLIVANILFDPIPYIIPSDEESKFLINCPYCGGNLKWRDINLFHKLTSIRKSKKKRSS